MQNTRKQPLLPALQDALGHMFTGLNAAPALTYNSLFLSKLPPPPVKINSTQ
jgi:hypothetical protein